MISEGGGGMYTVTLRFVSYASNLKCNADPFFSYGNVCNLKLVTTSLGICICIRLVVRRPWCCLQSFDVVPNSASQIVSLGVAVPPDASAQAQHETAAAAGTKHIRHRRPRVLANQMTMGGFLCERFYF